jgi:ATP-binding cassette subfamily C (CFTR/MRP) protein 1
MNAALYKKALRLSSSARQEFPPGKITNMISSDAQRIEMFITLIHTIWTAPLQIVLITVFLILELRYVYHDKCAVCPRLEKQLMPQSYGAAIGVGLLLLLTPLQAYLWRILSTIRKEGAVVTDSRIKTTQEVLTGIRVIKFFTWENPFLQKIEELRTKEISYVYRRRCV